MCSMCQNFLFKAKPIIAFCVYTMFCLPIHPSMDNFIAIVNTAAMNLGVQPLGGFKQTDMI